MVDQNHSSVGSDRNERPGFNVMKTTKPGRLGWVSPNFEIRSRSGIANKGAFFARLSSNEDQFKISVGVRVGRT